MKIWHIYLIIVPLLLAPWVINFMKLTDCDFESNYKCEIIHALGVIPPVAFITVWFKTDMDN